MAIETLHTSAHRHATSQRSNLIEDLLTEGGITVNGTRPWDIQVNHPKTFERFLAHSSVGIGESYVDGWWDCEALDQLAHRVLREKLIARLPKAGLALAALRAKLFNLQSHRRAFQIADAHYNLGNDLFQTMLDKRMTYTCGYWDGVDSLDEAQEQKLDLVCRKIGLVPGMRVLDIGCGWGSFVRYAAEKYRADVVGITVSREQIEYGSKLCEGLPVELRLEDYRDTQGRFDRIVSLGMFEHVGAKNYRTFMKTIHRLLKPEGLFLLHTIGTNASAHVTDPWIGRYIFPNSLIPSAAQISASIDGLFVLEDWHNFGADYDTTLMAWWRNFEAGWPNLTHYGERFHRLWRYYLLTCAGSFRARTNNLWQIVLSPSGVPGGYRRPA